MDESIQWRQVFGTAVLWFASCSLVGLLVAAISGEHGSILFAMLGVTIGSCGAVSHAALLFSTRFKRLPVLWQYMVVWLAAMTGFFVVGAALSWSPREILVLSLYVAVPALVIAFATTRTLAGKHAA